MTIAYFLDYFPVLSETFIVREILELQKKKINVFIFARENTSHHKYSEVIHDDTKKLSKDVTYLSSLMKGTKIKRWIDLILNHAYFFLSKPLCYLKLCFFSLSKGRKIFIQFIISVFYARQIQNFKVDHIHVHFALSACTYAMFISRITGIPYSFTVHAHDIFIPHLADLLEGKFNNAKFVACISEFNKRYVLNQFPSINPDKIRIIHCGLDPSAFTTKAITENEQFTILSIGRLVEHKGFKYLVEACKKLKDKTGLQFTCNIIGEGVDRKDLEDLIISCELTDVIHLLGSREQADVMWALSNCDLFVLPCVTEKGGMQDGIPVVLMEAMAMGIPVVSTHVSGVPELVQNGAGILVEQKDAKGLAMAIEKIINMTANEKELMGRRGRAIVVEDFNIEKEVQKLAELIAVGA